MPSEGAITCAASSKTAVSKPPALSASRCNIESPAPLSVQKTMWARSSTSFSSSRWELRSSAAAGGRAPEEASPAASAAAAAADVGEAGRDDGRDGGWDGGRELGRDEDVASAEPPPLRAASA